jgi:hypothetical protein
MMGSLKKQNFVLAVPKKSKSHHGSAMALKQGTWILSEQTWWVL